MTAAELIALLNGALPTKKVYFDTGHTWEEVGGVRFLTPNYGALSGSILLEKTRDPSKYSLSDED